MRGSVSHPRAQCAAWRSAMEDRSHVLPVGRAVGAVFRLVASSCSGKGGEEELDCVIVRFGKRASQGRGQDSQQ